MVQGKPPTPYEPPWWDGISFKPDVHEHASAPLTEINASTGAAAARAAFRRNEKPPWRDPTLEMLDAARATIEYVSPKSGVDLIAYITIGNSDDKLQQHDWANFIRELKAVLSDFTGATYGEWYSAPDAVWQNMCICRELHRDDLVRLRACLRALRETYRQDSIALVVAGRTELV